MQMIRRARRRATFANVMSMLALFVALGGTSYAALRVGPGNIQRDAVRSHHVRNGSILLADLAPATRRALKGQRGAAGVDGRAGVDGANGANGINGTNGIDGIDADGIDAFADLEGLACERSGFTGAIDVTVAGGGAVSIACAFPPVPSGGSISYPTYHAAGPVIASATINLGSAPGGIASWRIERQPGGFMTGGGGTTCAEASYWEPTGVTGTGAVTSVELPEAVGATCNKYRLVVVDAYDQQTTYGGGFMWVDRDGDGDGYTEYLGGDCNDANANIHPGASEVMGDFMDQDCDGVAE